MSASDNDSKIDLLYTLKNIRKKISGAYCLEKDTKDNSLMIILERVLFPILEMKNKPFKVNRQEEYGGDTEQLGMSKMILCCTPAIARTEFLIYCPIC